MAETLILNVDDNEVGRYATSRILQLAGFKVIEAGTGAEAIEMAKSHTPDLVLLDINLPDLNGFEICRRLKSMRETAALPVLLMSASFTRGSDRVRGLEGGADGYLTEPLEPDVLIATVNALLRVRHAEAAVRQLARRWQTTFEAISDGVVLVDTTGRVFQCNDAFARLFGHHCDAVVGTAWNDYIPLTLPLAHGPEERASSEIELGDRWMRVVSDPILDEFGSPDGYVCIVSDITARKTSESELTLAKENAEAASLAKDQFLAVLSHELRTPLTPVLTLVQALELEPDLPDDMRMIIEMIRRNVELEARLIDDLLDLTRITRGKMQLALETVDAHALMRNVLEICQEDISQKRLGIRVELRAAHHRIVADPARMQQVFWNLVKNAVKFTPEQGTITVRSSSDDGRLRIDVTDNGIGITADALTRIFDAFEQGEKNTSRLFGGLGLGLSISKMLVEMHGGHIIAASAGKDQGATFSVILDTVDSPDKGTEKGASLDGDGGMVGRSILLVDDHHDTSMVLRLMLERRGYNVHVAHSVEGALEAARSMEIDLLISDIGLPDGSGLELMRTLKGDRAIKGIALSGFGMEEDIRRSQEAGFHLHLIKPVSFQKLNDAIEELMQ